MSIEIFDCDQGGDDWLAARIGIPTASEFSTLMASGKGGGESATRAKYMRQLAGEVITGKPMYKWSNDHMDRGKEQEDEARQLYAMIAEVEPTRVGFIRNNELKCGASPDSLIGDDGLLEIKTALADIQIERLLRMTKFDQSRWIPPEHVAQVQGQLWLSGRQWCDFVSYSPGVKLFKVRVYRDAEYIGQISDAVKAFNHELRLLVAKVS